MKDLIVLAADKSTQITLQAALIRYQSLSIKPISCDFRVHPGKDGGARTSGPELLAAEHRRFSHGLLVFDLEGSGATTGDPLLLESELDAKLRTVWGDRAKCVVVAPEVDIWLWGNDSLLGEVFRWPLAVPIRDWLVSSGFEFDSRGKPKRPKEALEHMVRIHRQPRSSALYGIVASKISLKHCTDEAFIRLRNQLQAWFGRNE
ncbi:MAG: methylation-associated defense system protein MAD4 [Burkholderiales bacterium]